MDGVAHASRKITKAGFMGGRPRLREKPPRRGMKLRGGFLSFRVGFQRAPHTSRAPERQSYHRLRRLQYGPSVPSERSQLSRFGFGRVGSIFRHVNSASALYIRGARIAFLTELTKKIPAQKRAGVPRYRHEQISGFSS